MEFDESDEDKLLNLVKNLHLDSKKTGMPGRKKTKNKSRSSDKTVTFYTPSKTKSKSQVDRDLEGIVNDMFKKQLARIRRDSPTPPRYLRYTPVHPPHSTFRLRRLPRTDSDMFPVTVTSDGYKEHSLFTYNPTYNLIEYANGPLKNRIMIIHDDVKKDGNILTIADGYFTLWHPKEDRPLKAEEFAEIISDRE
jgi:hypothetical protein